MNATAHSISCYELDVHWSSGRPAHAAVEAHIQQCEACQRYMAELDRHAGGPPPALDPGRARAARRAHLTRRIGRAASVGAALLMSSLCLFFAFRPRTTKEEAPSAYVGVKGVPAVQVLIRNEAGTEIWDGHSPVHPGDRIALQVACEGLSHITVAAPSPDNHGFTRIADADCAADARLLPFTLVVDDQEGEEHATVIVSAADLDDVALADAALRERRTADVWVTHLRFAKSKGRP